MNKHICTAALAAAALLALLPGCTTYDDKKHAARTKWDKVSAQARVTVAPAETIDRMYNRERIEQFGPLQSLLLLGAAN